MAAGSEPLLVTLRDAIAALIEAIDKDAEGYWFNYGRVSKGTRAWFAKGEDPERPVPHLAWSGNLGPRDALGGNELGYQRFIEEDGFELSFAVLETVADVAGQKDHDRKAMRIASDMHYRLIDPTNRRLGHTDSNLIGWPLVTWRGVQWFPAAFAGESDGGLLICELGLRHQHQSGDMSAGG